VEALEHLRAAQRSKRLLLVRKRNTRKFMPPGGKREGNEAPICVLRHELDDELKLELPALSAGGWPAPAGAALGHCRSR